jgi:hypothetical protein
MPRARPDVVLVAFYHCGFERPPAGHADEFGPMGCLADVVAAWRNARVVQIAEGGVELDTGSAAMGGVIPSLVGFSFRVRVGTAASLAAANSNWANVTADESSPVMPSTTHLRMDW